MSVTAAPVLPAPGIDAPRLAALERWAAGLSPSGLYWAASWLARHADIGGVAPMAGAGQVAPDERFTVVYGSQTGNARRVAEQLAGRAEAAGLSVRLVRADAYAMRELAGERRLAVVISTQGEGEPPDDARGLVEFLTGRRAPRLPDLQYAVLGLGDSSYPQFCAIGRQLDERLAALGAQRFADLAEADVDVDAVARPWLDDTLGKVRALAAIDPTHRAKSHLHAVPAAAAWHRARPFQAPLLGNQRIVSRDSRRAVHHVELSLEGSGLRYAPGDALGVWPRHSAALVARWLEATGLDGDAVVTHQGRDLPLRDWLASERELTRLHRGFVEALAATAPDLAGVLDPAQRGALATLMATHPPIDLLRRHPVRWDGPSLLAALRPLTPRLYSIASSPAEVGPDEVHLTVALVDYHAHGLHHQGAASAFLSALNEDGRVPVFVEANERFRLPTDPSRDIVMIGPGTGVAPFRAFVQERAALGAGGRNWLFFGNRRFAQDFLYQTEWQDALRRGTLDRLDLAFSRDGAAKVYVQDRLRECGAELYAWLEGGAYLYVCGDATRMAKDVHAALVDIAIAHGGRAPDDARAWLAGLLQQGRYARDVY